MSSASTSRTEIQKSSVAPKGFPWSLRRITTDGSWIREVDGLRFVAIISVVLYHIMAQMLVKSGHPVAVQGRYSYLETAIGNGDRGVRLFFVISGFVLGLGFARQYLLREKSVNLKKYFLRRITRLEPPYIFNLVFCALAAYVYYHEHLRYVLPHLLASVVYLHNLAYMAPSWINGVTWSLEVEIQFYILAPLISLLFLVRRAWMRRLVFLILIGIAGALQMEFQLRATVAALTIVFYIQYFLAGLLLTDLYLTESSRLPNHWLWDVVSVAGWPLVFLVPREFFWYQAILPFLILPLYIAAFKGILFRKFFRNLPIATIGGMCYSIYLWHFFVIGVFFKLARHGVVFQDFLANFSLQVIALGMPIAVVSVLAFVLIERPCMDPTWPRKLAGKLSRTRN
jgi:peptidoglycan/LPS O-acetylase OafA/YrhL